MDKDVDMEQFAKILDAALASNNPSVKKALRNFMLVASIAESETSSAQNGPFTSMLKQIGDLKNRLDRLEYENIKKYTNSVRSYTDYGDYYKTYKNSISSWTDDIKTTTTK